MSDAKPTYEQLKVRLAEAEQVIAALRQGEVDAVVNERDVLLLRLKEKEQALRADEQRYRAVVETETELVCRWRPGGVLTFVN